MRVPRDPKTEIVQGAVSIVNRIYKSQILLKLYSHYENNSNNSVGDDLGSANTGNGGGVCSIPPTKTKVK